MKLQRANFEIIVIFFIHFVITEAFPSLVIRKQRATHLLAIDGVQNDDFQSNYDILLSLEQSGVTIKHLELILKHLKQAGLCEDCGNSDNLFLIARDFVDRPEVFSSILISDFLLPPLIAHQTRAVVMKTIKPDLSEQVTIQSSPMNLPTIEVNNGSTPPIPELSSTSPPTLTGSPTKVNGIKEEKNTKPKQ